MLDPQWAFIFTLSLATRAITFYHRIYGFVWMPSCYTISCPLYNHEHLSSLSSTSTPTSSLHLSLSLPLPLSLRQWFCDGRGRFHLGNRSRVRFLWTDVRMMNILRFSRTWRIVLCCTILFYTTLFHFVPFYSTLCILHCTTPYTTLHCTLRWFASYCARTFYNTLLRRMISESQFVSIL